VVYENRTLNSFASVLSPPANEVNSQYSDVIMDPYVGLKNVGIGSMWAYYYGGIGMAAESGKKIVEKFKKQEGIKQE